MIQKLCGARYSKQTISNITDKALECVDSFKKQNIEQRVCHCIS